MMKLISVIGPTASGKTRLAVRLAAALGREVLSADSRQVYRGMDIGTGKDLDEYVLNGKRIPCHLIDIREPGYRYSVFEYQRDFLKAFRNLESRGVGGVLCGGSGLYVEAAVKGYELREVPRNEALRAQLAGLGLEELTRRLAALKRLHNTTDVDTPQRAVRAIEIELYYRDHPREAFDYPVFDNLYIGLAVSRETRRRRIDGRLRQRLDAGLVDEVRGLLARGVTPDDMFFYGLEYKHVTRYLLGEVSYGDMVQALNTAIHQFAKRQMTWFRGMERRGARIHWVDGEAPFGETAAEAERLCREYLGER